MEFPCENCLTRSPCKNDAKSRHRSIDYRMMNLIGKCPELKEYIFPDGEFDPTRYHFLERFIKE